MTETNEYVVVGDPAATGVAITELWRKIAKTTVEFCVAIKAGFDAFKDDEKLLDVYYKSLIAGGVLTNDDQRAGRANGSKLSYLFNIAEHRELLSHPEIAPYLPAGPTPIYQSTVLFKAVDDGDEAARIAQFSKILQRCPDSGATEYLRLETSRLKKRKREAECKRENTDDQAPIPTGFSLTQLLDAHYVADLALITPSASDLARLAASDRRELGARLPLHELRAPRAAAIILLPPIAVVSVADKLLPLCGFDRASRILLPSRLNSSEATGTTVAVVAARNGFPVQGLAAGEWLEDEAATPIAIAERLCPDATRRLHVFAQSETDGWTSLVGDGCWIDVED